MENHCRVDKPVDDDDDDDDCIESRFLVRTRESFIP
jgi:hypothetical protein